MSETKPGEAGRGLFSAAIDAGRLGCRTAKHKIPWAAEPPNKTSNKNTPLFLIFL